MPRWYVRTAGLDFAINACWGLDGLAKRLGVSKVAVCKWRNVPEVYANDIERITGIPRHILMPAPSKPRGRKRREAA
jgi:hypothetical protein